MVAALLLAAGCNGGSAVIGGGGKEDAKLDTGTPEVADTGDTAAGDTDTGPDPLDEDADDDGYTPREGDCDDTLPHVYPGAPDYCDGLDQDCDGEPIPDGSCGEEGDVAAMWTWSFESDDEQFGGVLSSAGDVDGDGRSDLESHRTLVEEGRNESGVLYGAQLSALPPVNLLPALQWERGGSQWMGSGADKAGDVDADGLDDLWTTTPGDDDYTGAIFLHYGTGEMIPATGEDQQAAAAAYWYDGGGWRLGSTYYVAGDWTGDGRSDELVFLRAVAGDQPTRWAFLTDTAAPQRANHLEDLPALVADVDSYGQWANAGDLDGDGFDELVSLLQDDHDGLWREIAIVEGEDFVDGALVSEVAHRAWYTDEVETDIIEFPEGPPPDIDGDGRADLTIGVMGTNHALMVLTGGIPTGDVRDSVHVEVRKDSDWYPWALYWGDDIDGDGLRELMPNSGCAIRSTLLTAGGVLEHDAAARPCLGGQYGYVQALTDMTGDGRAEWVFYEQYWQAPGANVRTGRSLIVEGFDIPWEDPDKW